MCNILYEILCTSLGPRRRINWLEHAVPYFFNASPSFSLIHLLKLKKDFSASGISSHKKVTAANLIKEEFYNIYRAIVEREIESVTGERDPKRSIAMCRSDEIGRYGMEIAASINYRTSGSFDSHWSKQYPAIVQ